MSASTRATVRFGLWCGWKRCVTFTAKIASRRFSSDTSFGNRLFARFIRNVFLLLASRSFHRPRRLRECTKPCPDGLSAPRGAEDVRAPAWVFALPGMEVGSQSIKGRGSRCSRSSWTRWCSSRRTARGSRSGYSYRRSTDTVGSIEVPVIRRTKKQGTDCVRGHPLYFQAACAAENPLAFCAACGPQDTQRGMRPPLHSPVRGVFGGGSRCSRSSWTRWRRPRRTARGPRSGNSNRRSTDTGRKHRSSSHPPNTSSHSRPMPWDR